MDQMPVKPDGVGPVDNRPSPTSFTKLSKNKNVHVPKMQHNTTQIFQIFQIYQDKIIAIKLWRQKFCDKNIMIKILR